MGRGGAGVGESNHEQRKKDGKGKTWQKKGRKEEERKGRKEGNMCIEGVRQKKCNCRYLAHQPLTFYHLLVLSFNYRAGLYKLSFPLTY